MSGNDVRFRPDRWNYEFVTHFTRSHNELADKLDTEVKSAAETAARQKQESTRGLGKLTVDLEKLTEEMTNQSDDIEALEQKLEQELAESRANAKTAIELPLKELSLKVDKQSHEMESKLERKLTEVEAKCVDKDRLESMLTDQLGDKATKEMLRTACLQVEKNADTLAADIDGHVKTHIDEVTASLQQQMQGVLDDVGSLESTIKLSLRGDLDEMKSNLERRFGQARIVPTSSAAGPATERPRMSSARIE